MSAHLLYERIRDPQSTKDDLSATLPELFGSRSVSSLRDMVMANPQADFYPSGNWGTIHTALSYSIRPGDRTFEEITVKLAQYHNSPRWTTRMRVNVTDEVMVDDDNPNHTFEFNWEGDIHGPSSTKLIMSWIYHTSEMTFDFATGTVNIHNPISSQYDTTLPLHQLGRSIEDVNFAQSRMPIRIVDIELPQSGNPALGMTFLQRSKHNRLFNIVVPSAVSVDPARLARPIKEPTHKINT